MAVIFEEALIKEISSGNFAPVYMLFGEDTYLKKHYADKISEKAYDGDPFFNLQKFEGEISLQDVYDAVNQLPMMADMKCVVVNDFDFEHCAKSELDMFCELVSSSIKDCVLVLRFDTVEVDDKKSAKAKKVISAVEKGGGRAVKLNHRNIASLAKLLVKGAAKRGCKMSDDTARYLIENSGDDLNLLQFELDKLCFFANDKEIDKKTVDYVSVKSVEASVYDYVKEIFACNISSALKLLDDMFFMHIEPMIILYTASAAYVDIFRVDAATKSGVSRSDVAQSFGYKNRAFVLDRAAVNLKKLDGKKISLSFDALLEADRKLKSFSLEPKMILEELTLKLIYIIIKGEAVDKA